MQTKDISSLKPALDAILFVNCSPISIEKISEILEINLDEAKTLVLERQKDFNNNSEFGLQIVINENGIQLATKPNAAQYIQKLEGQKLVNLSLPALETLAVIAYKQPITKSEIEEIRGVNCDGVINTLLDKKLIYISGEKPIAGRPKLYSTTQDFLYYFGLKSLSELPSIPNEYIFINSSIENSTTISNKENENFDKNTEVSYNNNNLNDCKTLDDSNNKL